MEMESASLVITAFFIEPLCQSQTLTDPLLFFYLAAVNCDQIIQCSHKQLTTNQSRSRFASPFGPRVLQLFSIGTGSDAIVTFNSLIHH